MSNVNTWESELCLLRDAKNYLGKDTILSSMFPQVYHKNILFELLEQPYIIIPKGDWVLKPAISTEGVGYGVQFLNCAQKYVLQPKAEGTYLNVDFYYPKSKDLQVWIWGAKRKGTKFEHFTYIGADWNMLSNIQQDKISRIHKTIDHNFPLNIEFIGDTVIEAHTRLSIELCLMPPSAGDQDPIVEVCGATPIDFRQYKKVIGYPVFANKKEKTFSKAKEIFRQKVSLDNDKADRLEFITVGFDEKEKK